MSDAAVVCGDYEGFEDWMALTNRTREAYLMFILENMEHKSSELTDKHICVYTLCHIDPLGPGEVLLMAVQHFEQN